MTAESPRVHGSGGSGPWAADVAPGLLGARLRVTGAGGSAPVSLVLTEVEAYQGGDDPASHAFRGPTRRNAVMFGPAGRLYVYLSHGLHACANVVVGPTDSPAAVLLRAGRVVDGVEAARERRGPSVTDVRLARGPGNLCRALGITLADDGAVLDPSSPAPGPAGDLTITLTPPRTAAGPIASGPRVGISRAADVPWRFWLEGDPTVSAYRRSPRAAPPRQSG